MHPCVRSELEIFAAVALYQLPYDVEMTIDLLDLENRFDLDRDVSWQRTHADGAARTDPVLVSKHFGEQLAAAIDHHRLLLEIGGGVNHPQNLDHSFDAVQAAKPQLQ